MYSSRVSPPPRLVALPLLACLALAPACGDAEDKDADGDGSKTGDDDDDDDDNGDLPQDAVVPEFGESPSFTPMGNAGDGLNVPRDLAFHPARRNELWVVNMDDDSTVTYLDAGTPQQKADWRLDAWGLHFMDAVSSIAFGAGDTFGTCQESLNTYDGAIPENDRMGPTLWPGDRSIYAMVNQNNDKLGSHLDMLHENPLCMGIEWERDHVYWVFDGRHGRLVYNDFAKDHGAGGDDHSDGIIRMYEDAKVERVPGIASHLVLDRETSWLYAADTGNKRVIRLDITSGSFTKDLPEDPANKKESVAEYSQFDGATVEVVVDSGLTLPSGIELGQRHLLVSDAMTNEIVAYDDAGTEIARLATPAQQIMGITKGPGGKLWYVDAKGNELVRIDP